MKESSAAKFCCPTCGTNFQMTVFKQEVDEIIQGSLVCASGCFFPILNGIPRLLVPQLLAQVVSGKSLKRFVADYQQQLPAHWLSELSVSSERSPSARTAGFYRFQWEKYKSDFDKDDRSEWDRLTGGKINPDLYRD